MKRSRISFFAKNAKLLLILPLSLIYGLLTLLASCDSGSSSIGPVVTDTPQWTANEVAIKFLPRRIARLESNKMR